MKTIIFDIDGTIFDTKAGIIACINDVLKHYGKEPIPENDTDKYIGPAIKDSLMKFNEFSEIAATEATREYREKYVAKYVSDSTPYDGLISLLKEIKDKGHKLCIATMKTRGQVEKLLDSFKISGLFDIVETAKDEGGYTKADMLNSINNRVADSEFLFVGDTNGDYKAALKADMPFIYAGYGYGEIPDYEGMKINGLQDLERYL